MNVQLHRVIKIDADWSNSQNFKTFGAVFHTPVMAECMDEFDEATPLRGTYCSRLTSEEYEEQGAR